MGKGKVLGLFRSGDPSGRASVACIEAGAAPAMAGSALEWKPLLAVAQSAIDHGVELPLAGPAEDDLARRAGLDTLTGADEGVVGIEAGEGKLTRGCRRLARLCDWLPRRGRGMR